MPTKPRDDAFRTTEVMTVVDSTSRRASETSPPPSLAHARLICLVGACAGRAYPLRQGVISIGRGDDVDIEVQGPEISRHHACIEGRADGFTLRDLGGRNGTCVNSVLVQECTLRSGDRVELAGTTMFLFSQQDALEQRAMRLQQLESLAELASGMVHDFRNTLSVVVSNADMLAEDFRRGTVVPQEASAMLRDLIDAAQGALQLTLRLDYFARRSDAVGCADVKVAALLGEIIGMVRRSFQVTDHVQVVVDVDPRLVVRGNEEALGHAVLNLVLNARDAMPNGGRLSIKAVALTLGRAEALALHLPAEGAYVDLIVADTGVGMTDEVKARLFEPFFTTKPPGVGTGLGLSLAFGVIRNHGGNIIADSSSGIGSQFRVLLPVAAREQRAT